ncbi:Exodeoxyribonuclease III OS=Stutzerimonas stutzeri OX=316 GN=xth PE=3 SV=1 [Stutzerimonas stutzeri]
MDQLKLATFNINGIRARLPNLLEWLAREQPDVVCLQELKAQDADFPLDDIRGAGYGAIWHGQKSWNGVAILARGGEPLEIRRSLPGDPDDSHSRYLEAAVHGVIVACLYLPNGNPQPGPKFDYKLAWVRAADRARRRPARQRASGGAGRRLRRADRCRYLQPALLAQGRVAAAGKPRLLRACWRRAGPMRCAPAIPTSRCSPSGIIRQHWQKNSGLRIDHLLLSPDLAPRLHDAGVDRWVRGEEHASDHAPAWVLLDASGRSG